jgi:DNA-binding transcriptional MerR regulator
MSQATLLPGEKSTTPGPTTGREVKLTLKEFCHAANISERTVRYYIQQGLLPPPQGAGPASRYGLEHLSRLALIRRLKAALLPLNEIKQLLSGGVPTSDLEQVAHEFYDELTRTNPVAPEAVRQPVRLAPVAPEPEKISPALQVFTPPVEEEVAKDTALPARPEKVMFAPASKWNRIGLVAGLELHFEEGGPQDNAPGHEKLQRLLDFARQLYNEPA